MHTQTRNREGTPHEAFPHHGPPAQRLRYLLHYAVMAPSAHNTQPWLFDVHDDTVDLLADRSWALPVVDPNDRELVISCGAALLNLRVALRRFGYSDQHVEILPDPDDRDVLARVRLVPVGPPGDDDVRLFDAIPRRRTTRKPFSDRLVDDAVIGTLVEEAQREAAWLAILGTEQRRAATRLVAEGDRVQMRDRRFRRELAACVHPNMSRQLRGMRGYSFGLGDVASVGTPHVLRSFDMGKGRAAHDLELASCSPLLAVLGTDDDSPAEWLRAGQAMERVLLRACAEGITASFLNQPIEVSQLRSRLADAIGRTGSSPQILLRMGYGPTVPRAPRTVLPAVLTHRRRLP